MKGTMEHYFYKIQGWCNFQNVYAAMVEKFSDNSLFVEIGSWKGMSSVYMGVELINANKKNIKFVCIDTWGENDDGEYLSETSVINNTLYQEFLHNIKPLQENGLDVIPIRSRSDLAVTNFADNSIDFLYVDGSHFYENVKNDILLYLPKMKTNSIIAGHDWQSDDVRRAVEECFDKERINLNQNTWIVELKDKNLK